ncbi:discoidin domain-containing protein [Agriterribacter sp.]|uniref:galactose-binding domain-containing protein n=1 Tax=Agriterribacter sp. TaxID=2821509 RepID=UPI002D106A3F|nr:discoidin domain-containing protein [Agriterribacter sp.]HTN09097.1 discoidin domain-containing protein [Agriterribacter sp.]
MKSKFYFLFFALWGSCLFINEAIGQDINLALSKTGTASSIQDGTYTPDLAFDGAGQGVDPGTGKALDGNGDEYGRWSSLIADPQWIAVDLGAVYEVKEVKLYWEVAIGKNFNIEVTTDEAVSGATTWTTVATITDNPVNAYISTIVIGDVVAGIPARHVRMNGLTRNNASYGYSLYEFEVYGPNVILPITLNDFAAVKKDNAVQLLWNAGMDAESRFNVQRSNNGADFATIGKLYYPTGTNGISNSYGFVDESPLAGINYYRLQYTETGEKTLYSDILSVRFSEDRSFIVSPNPVAGNVIRVESGRTGQGKLTLRLLTITGKIIEQQEMSSNNTITELKLNKHLSAGTYILQVLEGNQPARSKQIIISK